MIVIVGILLDVYRVAGMLMPFLSILLGAIIFFKTKGVSRLIGAVLLLVGLVLIIIMIINVEVYGFLLQPIMMIFVGALLILSGAINSNKMLQKRKVTRFQGGRHTAYMPTVLVVIGAILVASYPAYEISHRIYTQTYPVTAAVLERDVERLEAVLIDGANPNELLGGMPLAKRVLLQKNMRHSETYEIFRLLLDNGYDVNEADEDGATPLMYTTLDVRYGIDNYDKYDLPSKLTDLFISHGADVNAIDNNGRTALMWACNYRGDLASNGTDAMPFVSYVFEYEAKTVPVFYLDQIKCLVESGADVGAQDKNGYRAIDYFKFAIDENSKNDYEDAIELYQSQEYLDMCKAIEELLQHK